MKLNQMWWHVWMKTQKIIPNKDNAINCGE